MGKGAQAARQLLVRRRAEGLRAEPEATARARAAPRRSDDPGRSPGRGRPAGRAQAPGSRTRAHAGRFYGSTTLAAVTLYADLFRYRELFLNLLPAGAAGQVPRFDPRRRVVTRQPARTGRRSTRSSSRSCGRRSRSRTIRSSSSAACSSGSSSRARSNPRARACSGTRTSSSRSSSHGSCCRLRSWARPSSASA